MDSFITSTSLSDALASAIAMFVMFSSFVGRMGPFDLFLSVFFGQCLYNFMDISMWRHVIADNGYGMRVFLFGSVAGVVSNFILKFAFRAHRSRLEHYYHRFHSFRTNQTLALIGSIIVWLFLPYLSIIQQTQ